MFPTPESVDQLMLANIRGLVRDHHTVLHLGDWGFFKTPEDSAFLKDLPGRWFTVRGNHDKAYNTGWFKNHGITEVTAPIFQYEGFEILFTHYPQKNLRRGQLNVAGHVHNNPWTSTPQHINVSVELWHYAPVHTRFIMDKVVWSGRTNADDSGPLNVRRPK